MRWWTPHGSDHLDARFGEISIWEGEEWMEKRMGDASVSLLGQDCWKRCAPIIGSAAVANAAPLAIEGFRWGRAGFPDKAVTILSLHTWISDCA